MKKILMFAMITLGMLVFIPTSHAIQSCKIEVEDTNNNIIKKFTATRGVQFGNRKVKKLYDCDTCWNGGKALGPKKGYCGAKNDAGEEYTVSCVKNAGTLKKKVYQCP